MNRNKKRKSPPALWQTERGIDEQPLCNVYSDSQYDNDDGNNIMHDDSGQSGEARSTSSSVQNDCDHSDETASISSGMQDDCDQRQSEDAPSTSSSEDDDGMEQVRVGMFIKYVI